MKTQLQQSQRMSRTSSLNSRKTQSSSATKKQRRETNLKYSIVTGWPQSPAATSTHTNAIREQNWEEGIERETILIYTSVFALQLKLKPTKEKPYKNVHAKYILTCICHRLLMVKALLDELWSSSLCISVFFNNMHFMHFLPFRRIWECHGCPLGSVYRTRRSNHNMCCLDSTRLSLFLCWSMTPSIRTIRPFLYFFLESNK